MRKISYAEWLLQAAYRATYLAIAGDGLLSTESIASLRYQLAADPRDVVARMP